LQELVYEGRHEPFANLKDQNVISSSQTHGMTSTSDSQNQKSHTAVKKQQQWQERMKDLFSTFSADHVTGDSAYTMTFWHSLRTRSNANDEPLAKILYGV